MIVNDLRNALKNTKENLDVCVKIDGILYPVQKCFDVSDDTLFLCKGKPEGECLNTRYLSCILTCESRDERWYKGLLEDSALYDCEFCICDTYDIKDGCANHLKVLDFYISYDKFIILTKESIDKELEIRLKFVCKKVNECLQNKYSDFWLCRLINRTIYANWNGEESFSLEYDGDWYISGDNLAIDMVSDIYEILKNINMENPINFEAIARKYVEYFRYNEPDVKGTFKIDENLCPEEIQQMCSCINDNYNDLYAESTDYFLLTISRLEYINELIDKFNTYEKCMDYRNNFIKDKDEILLTRRAGGSELLDSERDNGIGDCFDYITINFVDMIDDDNPDDKRCFKFVVSLYKNDLDKYRFINNSKKIK